MNVAIDYDSTYSAAPELFEEIIGVILSAGHKALIVTARGPLDPVTTKPLIPIIYCSGEQKEKICDEQKIKIDIWIDDNPSSIPSSMDSSWMNEYYEDI